MLYAMTRLWAGTREGLIRTVLVSAGIFGASHLIHIALGKPVPQTLLLAISAGLGGVFYGTITLRGGSIWPAVVAHGVLNGVISVAVLNQPDYSQTVSAWLLIILSQIPVALFSAYLIARTPTRSTIPDAP